MSKQDKEKNNGQEYEEYEEFEDEGADKEYEEFEEEPDAKTDEEQLDIYKEEGSGASKGDFVDKDEEGGAGDEAPEVDNSRSKIASGSKSSVAIIIVLMIILVFVVYRIISSGKSSSSSSENDANISQTAQTVSPPPSSSADALIKPQIPKLPDAPELIAPTLNNKNGQTDLPPPPVAGKNDGGNVNLSIPGQSSLVPSMPPAAPPSPPVTSPVASHSPATIAPPAIGAITTVTGTAASTALQNKYKSSMSAFGGGGGSDANAGPSLFSLKRTESGNQIGVSYIGDLAIIIAQGKIIDAVLETAISTDLQGPVRGIISRDVYAEAGKNVLVPKGSRIIGSYSSGVTAGTVRVQIIWNRLIRPDGVDVAIASPGIDSLGRTGVVGQYDARALAMFSNAAMVSLVQYTMAILQDRQDKKDNTFGQTNTVIVGSGGATTSTPGTTPGTTSTGTTGTTGTTGIDTNGNGNVVVQSKQQSQKSQAMQQTATQMSQVASQIGQNYYGNSQPRILVDQGTRVKIFVQKDIVFAGTAANQNGIVN